MDQSQDGYADFWNYLSKNEKDLVLQGQYLMNDVIRHGRYHFSDYSFMIFPFAKAYEGFLKHMFVDIDFITHLDYISDHFRLGKMLSPNLIEKLGERSLYKKITDGSSQSMADSIWTTWKIGRNEIFHYFPHNVKSVNFEEAEGIIKDIIESMEDVYNEFKGRVKKRTPETVVSNIPQNI